MSESSAERETAPAGELTTSAAEPEGTAPGTERLDGDVQQDSGNARASGETEPAEESSPASAEDADSPGAAESADSSDEQRRELPNTLTFRITRTTWIAVISVAICATPVATAHAWLLWVYLLPIALGLWVARMRTTVGADGATVRRVTGTTRFTWDEVQSIKLNARGWSEAVLTSGSRVKLPAVRVRDLSLLSEMSGGRVPDPAR